CDRAHQDDPDQAIPALLLLFLLLLFLLGRLLFFLLGGGRRALLFLLLLRLGPLFLCGLAPFLLFAWLLARLGRPLRSGGLVLVVLLDLLRLLLRLFDLRLGLVELRARLHERRADHAASGQTAAHC